MARHLAVDLWTKTCGLLKDRLSEDDLKTWILELEPRTYNGTTLVLGAPFGLFRNRVIRSFLSTIEACASIAAKNPCLIEIEIGQVKPCPTKRAAHNARHVLLQPRAVVPSSAKAELLRNKTFEGFFIGESNRLAYLAARQFAERATSEKGDPLFLYGGAGLGKTHLLLAIVHTLRRSGKKVAYCRGEDFVRRVAEALHGGRVDAFNRELRLCDALLIDGLHPLAGSRRAQQELCRLFDPSSRTKASIALTGDRPADELSYLEPVLAEHVTSGLRVEIDPLDRELRGCILRAQLLSKGFTLEEHVLARVIDGLNGSVREIEGLVTRLQTVGTQELLETSVDTLEVLILPHLSKRGSLDLNVIIDHVAWMHGLTREEILSRDRSRRVAWPRHIAAYLCRKLTPASLPEIGEVLGGRNHTSVLRAVRTVNERLGDDQTFAAKLAQMEKVLGPSPARRVA